MAEDGLSLKDYLRRYHEFACAVQASRVISLVADEALKDFPKGLPRKSRESVSSFMRDVANAITVAVEHMRIPAPARRRQRGVSVKSRGRLADTTLQLFIAQFLSGGDPRRPGDIDFPYRLRAQELVMLLAHLDAFFGDTLRVICLHNPSTLRRSKTLTWEDILACGSWDAIMRRLVETQAYDFGWKSTRDKVQSLEREVGLEINSPAEDLATIDGAEQARHVVVHNNCRMSHEYLRRTGRTDISIGDAVPLTEEFVEKTANAVTLVGSDLVVAVAKKFFDATATDLTGVFRRRAAKGALPA